MSAPEELGELQDSVVTLQGYELTVTIVLGKVPPAVFPYCLLFGQPFDSFVTSMTGSP
jgi:hypothetical protein